MDSNIKICLEVEKINISEIPKQKKELDNLSLKLT